MGFIRRVQVHGRLTLDEFQALVPPFEAAFQTHMAELYCALHNVPVGMTPWQPMV